MVADGGQSLAQLPERRPFQGDHEGQNLARFYLEVVALRQAAQLLFAMPELPDLGDVHADPAEGLTDIADDAGAVPDDEAEIKRAADFLFGLYFQGSRPHQARRAGEAGGSAPRQLIDIAKHGDRRRPAAGAGTDLNI